MATRSRTRTTPTGDCPDCQHPYEPHTARTPKCTVCNRYSSLASNARRARRDGSSPGLALTLREFSDWFAAQPRHCTYCTIDEQHLPALGLLSQTGLPVSRLGVDRLNPADGYHPANMALCCFGCNKARSNTFTASEMRTVGAAIAATWRHRLADQGIDWRPLH